MKNPQLKFEYLSNGLSIQRVFDLSVTTMEQAVGQFIGEARELQRRKTLEDPQNEFEDCFFADGNRVSFKRYTPFEDLTNKKEDA